ncbi:MAG: hypothetical protein ACFFF4_09720 [Candidatus Thorarchaeota archaeon]
MGKDSKSNALYLLGAIGSVMSAIAGIYLILSGEVFAGTANITIDRILLALGSVLFSIGLLGFYRDYKTYVPIIPFLAFNLYQIIGIMLQPYLHLGYFTPAHLVTWSIMFVAFAFTGYTFYLTREKIGGFAIIAAVINVIYAIVRIPITFMVVDTELLFYYQVRSAVESFIFIVVMIMFILAIRLKTNGDVDSMK